MSALEEIFSSRVRIRVLNFLLKVREVNITELVRALDINHSVATKQIDVLKKYGIVEERRYGRVRMIRLRLEDPRVKKLAELFSAFDSYQAPSEGAQSAS